LVSGYTAYGPDASIEANEEGQGSVNADNYGYFASESMNGVT
jgi:hypothetical protein